MGNKVASAIAKLSFKLLLLAAILAAATASPAPSPQKEVPVQEIIGKVIDGRDVAYDNVTVIGDLIFRNLQAEGKIKITKSRLAGVNLNDSSFSKSLDFSGSIFSSDADFSRAKFNEYTGFEEASFEKNVSFEEAEFPEAIFVNASFLGVSRFDYATFNDYVSFSGANFSGGSFPETTFLAITDFTSCKFDNNTDFGKASFSDVVLFKYANFEEGVDFLAATFDDVIAFTSSNITKANFRLAKFKGPSHFGSVNFSQDAIFDLAQFDFLAYFIGSQFDGNLSLLSAKIANINLQNTTFSESSKIFLKDADFSKFQTHWSHIKKYLEYDGAAYLKLVKNYKDLEWFEDADDCYYQYRSESQNLKGWGLSRISDMLACVTCGYGVRPLNPVLCSLALIIVCTGILWRGNGLRNPGHMDRRTELFDAMYYTLAVFFTIPLPDLKPQGRFRYMAVLERAISWTLFALLIATLGKVMIR